MIPTTLSANNTPTASSLNSSGSMTGLQHSVATTSKEMVIGIASLIIEGRAFAEDEFHMLSLRQTAPFQTPPSSRGGANNTTDSHETPHSSASTSSASLLLHGSDLGSASNNFGGRQSPKPSTSKAASGNSNNNTPILINITTNPHHAFGAATAPLFIETPNSYHSSSSAASSAESTHQRWTQKLCQLRQASGAANLTAPYEQKVAIEAAQSTSGEPELVSLAILDPSAATERGAVGGDYEIVRRVMLSRSSAAAAAAGSPGSALGSASSSPSSGGSENFLHSLQSLATTCLRGNSPSMDSPTGFALHYNSSSGSSSHSKYVPYRGTTNTTTPRFQSPYTNLDFQSGSASSSGSGVQSPKSNNIASHHKRGPKVTSTMTSSASSAALSLPCALTSKITPSTSAFTANLSSICASSAPGAALSSLSPTSSMQLSNSNLKSYPQQGPHCDQFLRKMGLAKSESAEIEDHYCDMSYVNITCSRWRAYCLKIEAIIERGEAICLEVFLGPANHKILLEQWIITYKEKVPPPTMTLPSLCSAIRSQLYFSQISAWCDLIRKSDKSIFDTGRIVYGGAAGMMGCAGDLATTTAAASLSCTPPNSSNNPLSSATMGPSSSGGGTVSGGTATLSSSSLSTFSRPRLNIFYRIRTHDATACFNSKPNIHNFPNVNISENCSISICLKSLPRINGGIPKLGATMAVPSENFTPANVAPKFSMDETPRSSRQTLVKLMSPASMSASAAASTAAAPSSASACYPNCDNQKQQAADVECANGTSSMADMKHYKNTPACSAAPQVTKNDSKSTVVASTAAATAAPAPNRQKCKFYVDETEQNSLDSQDIEFDDDLSERHCSNGSCGSLSHREKQLLKYRKRMLKRDKKQHNRKSFDDSHQSQQHCQPMEQGEDYDDDSEQSSVQTVALVTARHRTAIEMISTGTQTSATGCCEQCGGEKSLVCLNCSPDSVCGVDEMDASSVNSLSSTEIISTPRSKGDLLLQAIQRTPKAAKHKKQTVRTANSAPALNIRSSRSQSTHNAANELLNNNHLSNRSSSVACPATSSTAFNSLSPCSSTSSLASLGSGCQVCKRQKTQHNFAAFNGGNAGGDLNNCSLQQTCAENQHLIANGSTNEDDSNEADDRDGGKQHNGCVKIQFNDTKMSSSDLPCNLNAKSTAKAAENMTQQQHLTAAATNASTIKAAETDVMEEECFLSTTTVTSHHFVRNARSFDVSAPKQPQPQKKSSLMQKISEECFVSSTKLTPNFEGFVLSGSRSNTSLNQQQTAKQQLPASSLPPKPLRQSESSTAIYHTRSCTPTGPLALNIDCEFKTPTTTIASNHQLAQQQQEQPQSHKPTPKPTLLQVSSAHTVPVVKSACCSNTNCNNAASMQRKTLPKVNLIPIFCNGNSGCQMQHHSTPTSTNDAASSKSPESAFPFDIVTINRVKFERAAAAAAAQMCTANNNHQHYNNNNTNNSNNNNTATILDCNAAAVPVQKSNSAPTLPNSPSLSPRFAKQAAIYKRRSRHLSDRSDRSSLGSDEQYSDEDLDCGSSSANVNLINGMVISPMKQRARFAAKFSRQPLLGNLEESLLQRRITPKMEVLGFKVLLGASGLFCPTQLTIPAAAYFYELHGETLSTPYLCEIALPRKGYSVPRTGTVQVTLLNPLGTVVRMFVIPYDMHDMPPLHQTFIRQRILAEMSAISAVPERQHSLEHESNGMQNGDSSMQHSGQLENNFEDGTSVGDSCKQKNLGHFISAEHMKRLRYCIHLRFQTSRSGRLMLHTDIRLLISRRTDCDTAAAHAKGLLEAPNELITDTVMPSNPKYSVRQDVNSRI